MLKCDGSSDTASSFSSARAAPMPFFTRINLWLSNANPTDALGQESPAENGSSLQRGVAELWIQNGYLCLTAEMDKKYMLVLFVNFWKEKEKWAWLGGESRVNAGYSSLHGVERRRQV